MRGVDESGDAVAGAVPALEAHDLTVSYQKRPVLYGVDLAVPAGKLVGIVGPNGAGKSTLIKSIMGLVPASGGWVRVFGQATKENIARIGYVPQRESVDWDFPVNVMDVVLMGCYGRLGLVRRPGKAEREKAREALAKVGMEAYSKRQIANLSGGQQQRVFLARALAQESDLYLMDEPFAGVDAATEAAIITLLQEMRDRGKTVLVVHHDLATAREYFDMLLLLNMRVVAFGDTADVFTGELLQKTYGGRLTILSELADTIARQT
jgi:manganese/zinc/iron transport system ATP- binding protein